MRPHPGRIRTTGVSPQVNSESLRMSRQSSSHDSSCKRAGLSQLGVNRMSRESCSADSSEQWGLSPVVQSECVRVSSLVTFFGYTARTASSSWRVYGCCGCAMTSSVGPSSTILPACITMTRSQNPCTSARSWQMNRYDVPRSRAISRSKSTICACTVTSSALVASSQMMSGGLGASARAMAARWHWPPDTSCG